MEFDELDDGTDGDSRPPLPQPDRLWRHPSEVGALLRETGAPQRGSSASRLALLTFVLGALLSTGVTYVVMQGRVRRVPVPAIVHELDLATDTPAADTAVGPPVTLDQLAVSQRVAPAVVTLLKAGGAQVGSGVIFRTDGMVMTTTRVAGAGPLTAMLADGRRFGTRLIGHDDDTGTAVVGLVRGASNAAAPGFATATIGAAAGLRVGTPAVAMHWLASELSGPGPTAGRVSVVGATLDDGAGRRLSGMFEVAARLPDGGWGGPVVDAGGAVVGLTWGPSTGAADAGDIWATAIELDYSSASQLADVGRVSHAWLGIEGNDLSSTAAQTLGVAGGAVVDQVVALSPASSAGLGPGDVIVAIDGVKVSSMAQLTMALASKHPGQRVTLTVRNGTQQRSIVTVLVDRPAAPPT